MLWIGAVEDAKSIDDPITSASITGKSILDFENLDFKIARQDPKISELQTLQHSVKDPSNGPCA